MAAAWIQPLPWSARRPDPTPAGAFPRVFLFRRTPVESSRAQLLPIVGVAAADVRRLRSAGPWAHGTLRLRGGPAKHQPAADDASARQAGPAVRAPDDLGPVRFDAHAAALFGACVALVGWRALTDARAPDRRALARWRAHDGARRSVDIGRRPRSGDRVSARQRSRDARGR